jgi:hypothetical protein
MRSKQSATADIGRSGAIRASLCFRQLIIGLLWGEEKPAFEILNGDY